MAKGKTNYKVRFNCDPGLVNKTVQDWLAANSFKLVNQNNEEFYLRKDMWFGNKGFQYRIIGNVLDINAGRCSWGSSFNTLDSGALGNMASASYKNSLISLFEQIKQYSLNNPAYVEGSDTVRNDADAAAQDISSFVETLKKDADDESNRLCNFGLIISIITLAMAALNSNGLLGIFPLLAIYFSLPGLKSSKKNKAILAIVLAVLAVAIVVFKVATAKPKYGRY